MEINRAYPPRRTGRLGEIQTPIAISTYFTEPSAAGRRSEDLVYLNYFTERSEVYFNRISLTYFTELARSISSVFQ